MKYIKLLLCLLLFACTGGDSTADQVRISFDTTGLYKGYINSKVTDVTPTSLLLCILPSTSPMSFDYTVMIAQNNCKVISATDSQFAVQVARADFYIGYLYGFSKNINMNQLKANSSSKVGYLGMAETNRFKWDGTQPNFNLSYDSVGIGYHLVKAESAHPIKALRIGEGESARKLLLWPKDNVSKSVTLTITAADLYISDSLQTLGESQEASLTFYAAFQPKTLYIKAVNDGQFSQDTRSGSLAISGTNSIDYHYRTFSKTLTIDFLESDLPSEDNLTVSASSLSVAEGAAETITYTLSGMPTYGYYEVALTTATSDTATLNEDYTLSQDSLVFFTEGETSASDAVTITTLNDGISEDTELVTLTAQFSSITSSVSDVAVATSITNDALSWDFAASSASFAESSTEYSITITLTQEASTDTTIAYTVSNVTTTAEQDHTLTSGSIIIPAHSLTGSIIFVAISDDTTEGSETFTITLTGGANNSFTGTITD